MSAQFYGDSQAMMQLNFDQSKRLHEEFKQRCQNLLGSKGTVLSVKIDDVKRYGAVVDSYEAALCLHYHWTHWQGDRVMCFVEPTRHGWSVTRWPKASL